MNHKLSTFFLVAACFLGMNASLWGQSSAAAHGIRGYLDPQTGSFHTIPHPVLQDDVDLVTLTTFTGKLVANFTITVDSTIASTGKIACELDAETEDAATGNFIEESAASAVTRGSATTVACSVHIPYSWKLGSASSDTISMNYTISSPVEISAATAEYPLRSSSQSIGTIKVPASGTTTTETIAVTF